jgi:hypothetical protein
MSFTLKWNGSEATRRVHRSGAQGLKQAAEFVLDQSNQRAPIQDGTLINSGATDVDEAAMEAVVTYDTPYAIKQHEDLSLRHPNGRQAKFLESAAKDNIERITDYLAQAIGNEVSG